MNDYYPTEDELDMIANWKLSSSLDEYHMLMAYVRERWAFGEQGYWIQDGDIYFLATAGWSGNEDLIEALQRNHLFCALYWQQSRRGGRYMFAPSVLDEKVA